MTFFQRSAVYSATTASFLFALLANSTTPSLTHANEAHHASNQPLILAENTAHGKQTRQADKMGTAQIGHLSLSQGWIRQAPAAAKVMAGYLQITNHGDQTDRLLRGKTEIAKRIEVHTMSMVDGVMKMSPLSEGLEIAPHETVLLKPGSFHLMFMGSHPPAAGSSVAVTLSFEKAGDVTLTLPVIPASKAASKDGDSHEHGSTHKMPEAE